MKRKNEIMAEEEYARRKATLSILVAVTAVAVGGMWAWTLKTNLAAASRSGSGFASTRAALERQKLEFEATLQAIRHEIDASRRTPGAAASNATIVNLKEKVLVEAGAPTRPTSTP